MSQNSKSKKQNQGNWWLIVAIITLTALPPLLIKGEYGGADGEAQEAITEINPEYQPWFKSVFKPASAEIESLLFVVQGAIGAGVVGYAIGLYQGRKQRKG